MSFDTDARCSEKRERGGVVPFHCVTDTGGFHSKPLFAHFRNAGYPQENPPAHPPGVCVRMQKEPSVEAKET